MAKTSGHRTASGPARVRFIMIEAEGNEGDLNQITQAIQNALRPQSNGAALPRVAQQARLTAPPVTDQEVITPDEHDEEQDVDTEALSPRPSSLPREPKAPRKFRTPQVLTDVDLSTPISFLDYAKERNPSSDRKKYLTVAAWFKEHRGLDAIGADHAYTCFRAIKWNTQIEDFQAPLRALKRDQLVSGAGRGLFAINHLGLAEVDKHD